MSEETNQTNSANPYITPQDESSVQRTPNEPPPTYSEATGYQRLPPKPQQSSVPSNPNSTALTRYPCDLFCPTCQQIVHSRVQTSSTILTFLLAVLLFFFCFCLFFIPFCISACKRTKHYCPNCNHQIGEIHEFE